MKKNRLILIIILAIMGLTPLIWFWGRPEILINGSDTNFPLNPLIWFQRRFFVWNGVANAGADFSSSIAGIFFHLIQVIPYSLGLNLQAVEIVSLVFWFSMIVFSSYIFSGILFGKKILPRLVLVCIYTFNIYLFNSWENVKVANLALVASLPLLIWIFWSYLERKINLAKLLLYSCLVGILASGSGINPAYFVTLIAGLVLAFVVKIATTKDREGIKQIFIALAGILVPLVLVNLFWIIPTLNYLFLSDNGIKNINDIGFTNWLDSLSENTSLFNVLRLQGAWDWYAHDDAGAPLYIPYAPNYFSKFAFIAFSTLLTGLGFLSLAIRKKNMNEKYLFFALLLAIGVFLGVGSHAPTGELYKLMVEKIPFFSFFRSPWYIFTPYVVLAIASLVALFFDWFEEKISKKWSLIFVTGFLLSNFLYNYPLVTGKIFRPASPDNFLINFPEYVFTAGDWATKNVGGRIIGYPDDEIERFNWGYTGIESVLNLISSAETVFSSLNQANFGFNSISKEFYLALKKDQFETALNLSGKMNVEYIFDKADQRTLAPKLPNNATNLEAINFGFWTFFKIPDKYYVPKIYSPNSLIFSYPPANSATNLGIVGLRDVLVNPLDSVVNKIPDIHKGAGVVLSSRNSQVEDLNDFLSNSTKHSYLFKTRDVSSVEYTFEVPVEGNYSPLLEERGHKDFGIDTIGPIPVVLDDKPVNLYVDSINDYIKFKPVRLAKGQHKLLIKFNNSSAVLDMNFGDSYLELINSNKDSLSKDYQVPNFDGYSKYLVEVSYLYTRGGDNATIFLKQRNSSNPLRTQVIQSSNYSDWSDISYYFDPVPAESTLDISLVANGSSDPRGTKVAYDNLRVSKLFTNKLFFVEESNSNFLNKPGIKFTKNSPVSYSVSVEEVSGPHVIVFSENYSSDWRVSVTDKAGNSLPLRPLHFSVNGFANAWYLDGTPKDYKMTITFVHQRLFIIGGIISGATLLACISYLIVTKLKNAKH